MKFQQEEVRKNKRLSSHPNSGYMAAIGTLD